MALEALGPPPHASTTTATYSVAMEAQHQVQSARYHLLSALAAWEIGGEYKYVAQLGHS